MVPSLPMSSPGQRLSLDRDDAKWGQRGLTSEAASLLDFGCGSIRSLARPDIQAAGFRRLFGVCHCRVSRPISAELVYST
jgi:hypothetical protein